MEMDNISGIPEWREGNFDDDGEGWKPNLTRDACKAMYEQWKQVMIVLKGALDSMKMEKGEDSFFSEYWEDYKGMLLGDAYKVAVKIQSSETGLYIIRMENASIIRKNAQHIKSAMLMMIAERVIEESHGRVIRAEIDEFRELFRNWVDTFEKDEFEDEWGLF